MQAQRPEETEQEGEQLPPYPAARSDSKELSPGVSIQSPPPTYSNEREPPAERRLVG